MAAITVTWDEVDGRWEGNNGETVHHNGTTWEANLPNESPAITNCTASIDGGSVGEYIDPLSTDIIWSCGITITAGAGGAGDPHIKPIIGKPYTI